MNVIKTHDALGYRLAVTSHVKTTEEYLMLEKQLATLLNNGGPVHYWGGHDSGVWVQSDGEMQTYSPWMRTNEAITELILEHEVWATPYPVEDSKCYEGKFYFGGRFHSVYVPYNEHQSKALAYRYAVLLTAIAKLRRTQNSVL